MDDKKNGQYSRTPELQDVISLCRYLNSENVRYVVIGGVAVILHGFARGTKDIDLLVDSSDENVGKLKRAMAHLPDNAISQIEDHEVRKYKVVRIADEFVVDLMEVACGVKIDEAERDIDWYEIEGVKIPLAGKKLLIKMKDTIRHSDKMDTNFLKSLIEAEKKANKAD